MGSITNHNHSVNSTHESEYKFNFVGFANDRLNTTIVSVYKFRRTPKTFAPRASFSVNVPLVEATQSSLTVWQPERRPSVLLLILQSPPMELKAESTLRG